MAVTKTVEERVVVQDPATTVQPVNTISTTTEQEVLAAKLIQVVYFIFGVIEVLLVLRVVFLLFAASRTGFVSFIYNVTYPFVYPFLGIFPAPAAGGAYFDTAALLAIIIIALIAWGIASLIDLLMTRPR